MIDLTRYINAEICQKCPLHNSCSTIQNVLQDMETLYIDLNNKEEFEKYMSLSIKESRSIAAYETNHATFLSKLFESQFNFDAITYYILDIKFSAWRNSISSITDLLKYNCIVRTRYGRPCLQFKSIINKILEYHKQEYHIELMQIRKYTKNTLSREIIDYFLEIHSRLFEKFKSLILSLDIPTNLSESLYYLSRYTSILIQAMELTTVELASINRILIDNKVYVTAEVVNWKLEKDFDLIKNIIDVINIPIHDIIYAEKGLERTRYLFQDYITRTA